MHKMHASMRGAPVTFMLMAPTTQEKTMSTKQKPAA